MSYMIRTLIAIALVLSLTASAAGTNAAEDARDLWSDTWAAPTRWAGRFPACQRWARRGQESSGDLLLLVARPGGRTGPVRYLQNPGPGSVGARHRADEGRPWRQLLLSARRPVRATSTSSWRRSSSSRTTPTAMRQKKKRNDGPRGVQLLCLRPFGCPLLYFLRLERDRPIHSVDAWRCSLRLVSPLPRHVVRLTVTARP